MKRSSLALRLVVGGTFAILVAVSVAGFGLVVLFDRHVLRVLDEELALHLGQLVGGLESSAEGPIARPPTDPRFDEPFSGRYWQVQAPDGTLHRSRSLWDERLPLPADGLDDGDLHEHQVAGPGGSRLLVAERIVRVADSRWRVAVAADLAGVRAARDGFLHDLIPGLAVLALVLAIAGWAQIRSGLRPLASLGAGIAALSENPRARLDRHGAAEVEPLIAELNALLDARDREVDRARNRAGDLAHGLKTPLAALMGDAQRLRAHGETELAAGIETVAETMRRHVERELTRARLQVRRPGRAATPVAGVVAPLVETLRRTPDGQRVDFVVDVPATVTTDLDREELAEVLGNLAENAARHAVGMVRLTAQAGAGLTVEDDGPGIAEADRLAALERGRRLDETGPGTGFGLAIVREILEAHGLALELGRSSLGGLSVRFDLARRDPA